MATPRLVPEIRKGGAETHFDAVWPAWPDELPAPNAEVKAVVKVGSRNQGTVRQDHGTSEGMILEQAAFLSEKARVNAPGN
jgi:hypothetical protein